MCGRLGASGKPACIRVITISAGPRWRQENKRGACETAREEAGEAGEREGGPETRAAAKEQGPARAGAGDSGGKGGAGRPRLAQRLTCLPYPSLSPSRRRQGESRLANCLSPLLRGWRTEAAGMLTFQEVLSRSEGSSRARFLQELNNETVTV